MIAAAWVVVAFCRAGSMSVYGSESTAREALALINGASCGRDCTRQHILTRWEAEP